MEFWSQTSPNFPQCHHENLQLRSCGVVSFLPIQRPGSTKLAEEWPAAHQQLGCALETWRRRWQLIGNGAIDGKNGGNFARSNDKKYDERCHWVSFNESIENTCFSCHMFSSHGLMIVRMPISGSLVQKHASIGHILFWRWMSWSSWWGNHQSRAWEGSFIKSTLELQMFNHLQRFNHHKSWLLGCKSQVLPKILRLHFTWKGPMAYGFTQEPLKLIAATGIWQYMLLKTQTCRLVGQGLYQATSPCTSHTEDQVVGRSSKEEPCPGGLGTAMAVIDL